MRERLDESLAAGDQVGMVLRRIEPVQQLAGVPSEQVNRLGASVSLPFLHAPAGEDGTRVIGAAVQPERRVGEQKVPTRPHLGDFIQRHGCIVQREALGKAERLANDLVHVDDVHR